MNPILDAALTVLLVGACLAVGVTLGWLLRGGFELAERRRRRRTGPIDFTQVKGGESRRTGRGRPAARKGA